jgi:hypothetical protein
VTMAGRGRQEGGLVNEAWKVLSTGLEGMTVSPEFSAAGSPTPRGAGLGFNF